MGAVVPVAAAPAVEVVVVEAMDIAVVPVAPFLVPALPVTTFFMTAFLRHRLCAHPGRQPGRKDNPQDSLHRGRHS
jgi:hypothetical protein